MIQKRVSLLLPQRKDRLLSTQDSIERNLLSSRAAIRPLIYSQQTRNILQKHIPIRKSLSDHPIRAEFRRLAAYNHHISFFFFLFDSQKLACLLENAVMGEYERRNQQCFAIHNQAFPSYQKLCPLPFIISSNPNQKARIRDQG